MRLDISSGMSNQLRFFGDDLGLTSGQEEYLRGRLLDNFSLGFNRGNIKIGGSLFSYMMDKYMIDRESGYGVQRYNAVLNVRENGETVGRRFFNFDILGFIDPSLN